jgi:hypothetical protein
VNYNPAFTWPIAFATLAVAAGVLLAVARRRRKRSRGVPPAPARMSRPPALDGETASGRPAFDSIYQIDPRPDAEGGEST